MKETEDITERYISDDRMLFSSLMKHIAQSAPNEDPSDFILASIWAERGGRPLLCLSVLGFQQVLHVHKYA